MKNNVIYVLAFAYLLIPTSVAKANIVIPGVADGFLISLSMLFISFSVLVFFLPILFGLIFPRRFIIVWHFLMFFAAIIVIAYFVKNGFSVITEMRILVITLLLSILYTSFFTIIAYVASIIGTRFKKIQKVQNILHRSKPSLSKLFIFLVYAIALTPMVFISEHNPYMYLQHPGIILGVLTSLIVGIAFFFWLYKKAAKLPERNFTNQKKDWLYFAIVVVIFTIAFVLSLIFYPGSYPSHSRDGLPPSEPGPPSVLAPDGNKYHRVHKEIEVGEKAVYIAETIISFPWPDIGNSEFVLIYGEDVREYDKRPHDLTVIDNTLVYFFSEREPDGPRGYADIPRIRHGDKIYGDRYRIIGDFFDYDNKVTFIARQEFDDITSWNNRKRTAGFLIQNGEIVSETYEDIDNLILEDDKLIYDFKKDGLWYVNDGGQTLGSGYEAISILTVDEGNIVYRFKKDGLWYLSVNGREFGIGLESGNDFDIFLGLYNEQPVYSARYKDEWFLFHGDRIFTEGYRHQDYLRSSTLSQDGVIELRKFVWDDDTMSGSRQTFYIPILSETSTEIPSSVPE